MKKTAVVLGAGVLFLIYALTVKAGTNPLLKSIISCKVLQDGGSYYSYGEASFNPSSKLSRRNAYMAAETEALNRLLEHVLIQRIIVPESLSPLKSQLLSALKAAYFSSLRLNVQGVQVWRRNSGESRSWCIIKVPEKSLAHIHQINGRIDDLFLKETRTNNIRAHPALIYECLSLHYSKYANKELLKWLFATPGLGNIKNILSEYSLDQIPLLWWSEKEKFLPQELSSVGDAKLLELLNQGVLLDWCRAELCKEWKRRGYIRFSAKICELLSGNVAKPDPLFLTQVLEYASTDGPNLADIPGKPLFSFLLKLKAFAPLRNHKVSDDAIWQEAQRVFGRKNADFDKIYALCLRSIAERPSADAFNLMGRCLQLQKKSSAAALLSYGQALRMDPSHPYASANIALLAHKEGASSLAKTAARFAMDNPKLAPWARSELSKVGLGTSDQ